MIDYQTLLDEFDSLRAQASNVETPNPEDHARIKLAMVGFAQCAQIENWEYHHFEFIQNRIDSDLQLDEFTDSWIDFACLSMGYLLGLLQSGIIDSVAFGVADAHLPGFMMLHSEEFA